MKSKMIELAKKMWVSDETIKTMESDMSKTSTPEAASVTVAVVKKDEEPSYDISDEQIDKMSEQEAKDMLKKWREVMGKKEEESEDKSPASRIMDFKGF